MRRLDPVDGSAVISSERRLITRFRQRSLPLWPEGYPQNDWEHLFAMQHYGVPTRLLDWSESLLVAAYFAADHDPTRCECGEGDCLPTVWVLDPVKFNSKNPRLQGMNTGILATSDEALAHWTPGSSEQMLPPEAVAIYGTHNSSRIVAQQGTFTVDGRDNKAIEETVAVVDHDGVLEKITVSDDRDKMKMDLRVLGVTLGRVYPDMTGLAQDITAAELG
jgi:FRG domain